MMCDTKLKAKINWLKIKLSIGFDFVFRKRYWIGGVIFTLLVIFGCHGSSIGIYNDVIQSNNKIESASPIVGDNRLIRSDEWAVNTPTMLSQIYNNFDEKTEILNDSEKYATFYPKEVSKSLSAISMPNQLGFLFLPKEQAFSFAWYFGYFLLFFSLLEFLMILTKGNKIFSALGAILITFSPVVQWWDTYTWIILGYGFFALVMFNKFLKERIGWKRVVWGVLIGVALCCYIECMYPVWQISYGYLFLVLVIWLMILNKKDCNFKKIFLLGAIISITMGIVMIPAIAQSYDALRLTLNTVYPGARESTGGSGAYGLFSYYSSIFYPFNLPANVSELSQYVSLFPVPIIMGVYYWYRNHKMKKKDFLLIALTLLAILLSIWNFVELPLWLTKVTLLAQSLPGRTTVVVGLVCVLLLIYCLSGYVNKKKEKIPKYQNLIIAISMVIIGLIMNQKKLTEIGNAEYMNMWYILFDVVFFVPVTYWCLNNYQKTNTVALLCLSGLTFVSGVYVHPLNIGLAAIYDKPIANEIQKIENEEPDATWIAVDTDFTMNNYLIANGANTINSTNWYPNFEVWEKLGLEDKENIYNRYSHMNITLTEEKSDVKLNANDNITLYLNSDDICKIDVDYIFARGDGLEKFSSNEVDYMPFYNEDGFSIYRVNCK